MSFRDELLSVVPDTPGTVDTRGILLEGAAVWGDLAGWVALRPDRRLLIAGGDPPRRLIEAARSHATPDMEALASGPAVERLRDTLGKEPTSARIHAAGGSGLRAPAGLPRAELLAPGATLEHLHSALRREVEEVRGERPVGVVLERGVPVSFCYPAVVTERYWDVSIETVEGFRRGGRAAAAFFRVHREMEPSGRQPVWGAAVTNPASLGLAAKLGFEPVAEVAWFV